MQDPIFALKALLDLIFDAAIQPTFSAKKQTELTCGRPYLKKGHEKFIYMLDVTNYSLHYIYYYDFSLFGDSAELNIHFSENLFYAHKRIDVSLFYTYKTNFTRNKY